MKLLFPPGRRLDHRVQPEALRRTNGLLLRAEALGGGAVQRLGDVLPLAGEPVDGSDYPVVGRILTGWHSCS